MLTASQVADYFITKDEPEIGETISNLKLQKLLYYAQGFSLACLDKPLFNNPVEAWIHGPVVKEIYHKLKDCGNGPLSASDNFSIESIPEEIRKLLDEVYDVYGQFSAWRLRDMTHEESPWKTTATSKIISHEKMLEYFKTQVIDS